MPDFFAEASSTNGTRSRSSGARKTRTASARVHELVDDVRLHGYYGGIRLVKATIKKFVEYCRAQESPCRPKTFRSATTATSRGRSGLAGSSAIIVATLRA